MITRVNMIMMNMTPPITSELDQSACKETTKA